MEKTTIAIMCGGKSRRMGTDKAKLQTASGTFLEKLVAAFEREGDIYLSVDVSGKYDDIMAGHHITYAVDQFHECGPLAGLHAVLRAAPSERVFVTTVDAPFADVELKRELESYMYGGIDAAVPVEADGRIHPLCAVYRTDIADILEEQLLAGNYRVTDMLRQIRVCYVPVSKLSFAGEKLRNVNTPADYQKLEDEESFAPIISVCAYSGSGKTTFLENVIRILSVRGVKVGAMKHDGHGYYLDKPESDSDRLAKAGADPVILFSDKQTVQFDRRHESPEELLRRIRGVDLILIEGLKSGPYKKILFYRSEAGVPAAMDLSKEEPLCIVSDIEKWPAAACPVIGLTEYEKAADILQQWIDCQR